MRNIAQERECVCVCVCLQNILQSTVLLITVDHIYQNLLYYVVPLRDSTQSLQVSLPPAILQLNGKPIATINNTIV